MFSFLLRLPFRHPEIFNSVSGEGLEPPLSYEKQFPIDVIELTASKFVARPGIEPGSID